MNTLNNIPEVQNESPFSKESKIEQLSKQLNTSNHVNLGNNQTLQLYKNDKEVTLQILNNQNQSKLGEFITKIDNDKNIAYLKHRLVSKDSTLRGHEFMDLLEKQLQKLNIKEIYFEASQTDVVERGKRQGFNIDEEKSNSLAKEYKENPNLFASYDFDLNMGHILQNVCIKKDILQDILLNKYDNNNQETSITPDDIIEYGKRKGEDIQDIELYIKKRISPRFFLTKNINSNSIN